MNNVDSQRIKEIRDNAVKMADAFTRIADVLERITLRVKQTEDKPAEPQICIDEKGRIWRCGTNMWYIGERVPQTKEENELEETK